jgi:hypothetical protein
MLMLVWFWTMSSAFLPAQIMSLPIQVAEAQRAVIEAATRPLMTLGWVDEDQAPIF